MNVNADMELPTDTPCRLLEANGLKCAPGDLSRESRCWTTDELATQLGLSPQTLRKRYAQTGSYFTVKPLKLPNRRLLWPADAIEQLIKN